MAIPSCILDTSHIYDGFSTLAVLFYFGIYGMTVLGGLINRITNKNQVHKVGYFIPFGIIAVIGCFFAFGYCVFYQFSTQVAMGPELTNANSFGFAMVKSGFELNN
ncbi:MAG: amino acid permease [Mycoplasmoidaceae bacterium]|nr:amino acid permease [Mycoplasmoidaceae bacterium]